MTETAHTVAPLPLLQEDGAGHEKEGDPALLGGGLHISCLKICGSIACKRSLCSGSCPSVHHQRDTCISHREKSELDRLYADLFIGEQEQGVDGLESWLLKPDRRQEPVRKNLWHQTPEEKPSNGAECNSHLGNEDYLESTRGALAFG